jgi:hypothetical protein|tara:strand:+ start:277 stop:927 length:651 start_codon:yes stop_codon:yes gene_type:complete
MNSTQQFKDKYEIQEDTLKDLITSALKATLNDVLAKKTKGNSGEDHHYHSQNWVKQFALKIEQHYDEEDLVSFFNRREPKLNIKSSLDDVKEFLFDITVAKINPIDGSPLSYISEPIWQIESEFKMLLKETLKDFQKLISGNAPYKMMVGPLNTKNDSLKYREITQVPASHISEDLYFLFITHPENWEIDEEILWKLYKWNGKDWGKVIKENEWKI